MTYNIDFTDLALQGLVKLAKSEPKAYHKALLLIEELKVHPLLGTGHPEPLKGMPKNRWSRRITDKHRLIYRVLKEEVIVIILSSYGHYDDK
jgi:toxin YoeB